MALSKWGAPQPWIFFDPFGTWKISRFGLYLFIVYKYIYIYIIVFWMISIDKLPTGHCQRLSNKICEHHIDTSVGPRRISSGRFEDGRTIERVRRQVMKGPGDLVILRESSTQRVWCASSIFIPASYHSWKSVQLKNLKRGSNRKRFEFWVADWNWNWFNAEAWHRIVGWERPALRGQLCNVAELSKADALLHASSCHDASVLSLYAWQPG